MVNKQILEYINSELKQGTSPDVIRQNLQIQGGWSAQDVEEVFSKIEKPQKISNPQKNWIKKATILFVVVVFGVAGYFVYKYVQKTIYNNEDDTGLEIFSEGVIKSKQANKENSKYVSSNYLEAGALRLISPTRNDELIAGAPLEITYEILSPLSNGMVGLATPDGYGDQPEEDHCFEFIVPQGEINEIRQPNPPGKHSFTCIIPEWVGDAFLKVTDLTFEADTDSFVDKTVDAEAAIYIKAADNLVPVDIGLQYADSNRPIYVHLSEKPYPIEISDIEFVSPVIIYNDGTQKRVAFRLYRVSIEDESLVKIDKGFSVESEAIALYGIKPGTTDLVIMYEGVTKKFPLEIFERSF